MLRMINLMTVWLIRFEGAKRSRSLAVLAALSSSSVRLFFFSSFFLLPAIPSSTSFEMPLNGLPRSRERNELRKKDLQILVTTTITNVLVTC